MFLSNGIECRKYLPTGKCFIAKHGNETVAVLVLSKTKPETVEIMNVAVREKYQSKGVGTQLIRRVIEEAKKQGMKTIELGTANSSVRQMLMYQKCGFRIVRVDFNFFDETTKKKYSKT
jgi:ribosomal protein S18 acetylase RimI-like enzyme